MATHSSTLAWQIPWTEEPGRLQSMGSLRVGLDWATSLSIFTFHFHALEKQMATHSSVLSWRIPGTGEPGGLPTLQSHRIRHDWSDLAAAAARTSLMNFLLHQIWKLGMYSLVTIVNRNVCLRVAKIIDHKNSYLPLHTHIVTIGGDEH